MACHPGPSGQSEHTDKNHREYWILHWWLRVGTLTGPRVRFEHSPLPPDARKEDEPNEAF